MESLAILENREWYVCRTDCSSPSTVIYGPHTFGGCVAFCTACNKSTRTLVHTFHVSQIDKYELESHQMIEGYLKAWAKHEVEEVA